MKIYVGHSKDWNYKEELYEPILESELAKKYEIILPHIDENTFDTKQVIEQSDLFIAEISLPSLGLGIEIGRAEMINKKILCIYKKGYKCPRSLKYVAVDVMEYEEKNDMISKIENYIKEEFKNGKE